MSMRWILLAVLGAIILAVSALLKYKRQLSKLLFIRSDIVQPVYSLPAKYAPQVLTHLVLPGTVKGLVGIREWTWTDAVLTSRNHKYVWTSSKMTADKVPDENNWNGIYAYRLGSVVPAWPHHLGIVEMLGHVEVHADGVVRADKCQILVIIVNWGRMRWAREISSRYNVPVYVSYFPEQAFREWLLGPDGMKWLNHNHNLLYPKGFKIIEDAEKLIGAR
jgi:hypothetical protein